jgi:hypothetical protein
VSGPPDTVLVITGIGLPPFSARGVTQTFATLPGSFERTVNGKLVSTSAREQVEKYTTTLTFNDTESPSLDGIFEGKRVIVDWIREFSYATGGSPAREVVEDSEHIEGDVTWYRPRMTMLVKAVSGSTPEWDGMSPAQLDLEEE